MNEDLAKSLGHSRVESPLALEVTVDLKLCCPRTDYGLVLVII